jgi:hypothetical protein
MGAYGDTCSAQASMEKTFQTLRSACAMESKPATSWALLRACGRLIQWAVVAAAAAVQASSGTAAPVAMLWHVFETTDWNRLQADEGRRGGAGEGLGAGSVGSAAARLGGCMVQIDQCKFSVNLPAGGRIG